MKLGSKRSRRIAQAMLLCSVSTIALHGSSLDILFYKNKAFIKGIQYPIFECISCTRASTKYAQNSSGQLVQFGNNVAAITDLGLLVEQASMNVCLQSQALGTSPWSGVAGGVASAPTITNNFTTAPDGTSTATRIQLTLNGGTTSTDRTRVTQTVTTTTTSWTAGIWLKSNTGSSYSMIWRDANAAGLGPITVTPTWTFFPFTETATTSTALSLEIRGAQTPVNSNSVDISAWGVQLENLAFATSYIPTTTSTVTRAADVITLTGAAATAALNARAARFDIGAANFLSAPRFLEFSGGARMNASATNQAQIFSSANSVVATYGSGSYATGSKVAFGFDAAGVSAIANGGAKAADTNAFVQNTGTIYIGNRSVGDRALNGYLRRATLGPTKGMFDRLTV